jgi:hypothetical protein
MLFTAVGNALEESPQWPVPTQLAQHHKTHVPRIRDWQSVSERDRMFQIRPHRKHTAIRTFGQCSV